MNQGQAAMTLLNFLINRSVVASVENHGMFMLRVVVELGDLNQIPGEWEGYRVVIERARR